MNETILNIYLVIERGSVTAFRAKSYQMEGDDSSKISFLKEKAQNDFDSAFVFDSPKNKKGEFMTYKSFSKLEKQGMQYQLFEEIFEKFKVLQQPLICVTPVVDGKVFGK
ncbi:MAG: hypothetical protein FD143_929 [Ignavibacteria bacterium]|nr:MAG: hypothetical protein FD143_929 [Ignavibacteria bacterium]KAF0161172.1 MAG: hypothetical protein FD188_1083 [Ignavibacteria bacterium]